MAYYKIDEIFDIISSMKKDGFEYVDISIVDVDDDDEENVGESLFIDAVISEDESESDIIDSVTLPDAYHLDV